MALWPHLQTPAKLILWWTAQTCSKKERPVPFSSPWAVKPADFQARHEADGRNTLTSLWGRTGCDSPVCEQGVILCFVSLILGNRWEQSHRKPPWWRTGPTCNSLVRPCTAKPSACPICTIKTSVTCKSTTWDPPTLPSGLINLYIWDTQPINNFRMQMEHMETIASETKAEAMGHFHDQKDFLIMQRSLTEHGATVEYFSVALPGSSQNCLCGCG